MDVLFLVFRLLLLFFLFFLFFYFSKMEESKETNTKEIKRQEWFLLDVLNQFFMPELSGLIADYLREDTWRVVKQWDICAPYDDHSGMFLVRTSPRVIQVWDSKSERIEKELVSDYEITSILLAPSGRHAWTIKWCDHTISSIIEFIDLKTSDVLFSTVIQGPRMVNATTCYEFGVIYFIVWPHKRRDQVLIKLNEELMNIHHEEPEGRVYACIKKGSYWYSSWYKGNGDLNEAMTLSSEASEWNGYWVSPFTSFATKRYSDRLLMLKRRFFDVKLV